MRWAGRLTCKISKLVLAYLCPAASNISAAIVSGLRYEGKATRLDADGSDLRVIETPAHSSYSFPGWSVFVVRVDDKDASSFAGSVLLALRLTRWMEPGGSQLSPAR